MCFGHDYTKVYIADTGTSHYSDKGAKAVIWEFPVEGERLGKGREFCSAALDGRTGQLRRHPRRRGRQPVGRGRLGRRRLRRGPLLRARRHAIGQIRLPEICGNLCFGGTKRNRLFMAASQSLYAVYVETRGAHIT
jgi:gluconolactonase